MARRFLTVTMLALALAAWGCGDDDTGTGGNGGGGGSGGSSGDSCNSADTTLICGDESGFQTIVSDCTRSTSGTTEAISQCIQGMESSLSTGCANCWGALGSCTRSNCPVQCGSDVMSQGCIDCRMQNGCEACVSCP